MKPVRVGVIGCGDLARAAHIPNLMRLPGAQMTAICDSDPVARRSCSELVPAAAMFGDADDLLAAGLVDAVVISLPTHAHAEAAIASFRAGAHVYLEKPIASRLDDAGRVVDAWRASRRMGMIGHNYRFNPLVARLKSLIGSGRIGRVTSVRTEFTTPAPASDNWRRSRATGGGALLDLAVHHVDLIAFVLDCQFESVSAQIESRISEHDVATLELSTTTAITADMAVSFGTGFRDRVEFHGETGVLWIDRARSMDVGLSRTPGRIGPLSRIGARLPSPARLAYRAVRKRSPYHEPSFAIAMAAFIDAVASGIACRPDMDDGFASLEVLEAAERSSTLQKPVAVAGRNPGRATEPRRW